MMDVVEAMRQMLTGADFTDPTKLLSNVSSRAACARLDGVPYSIASNTRHTDIWNLVLLARLKGLPKVNPYPDFPVIAESDWPQVRRDFLANLEEAMQIASAEPFVHRCQSDEAARKLLLRIAIHSTYHMGQINLLKRMLRAKNK